MPSTYSVFFVYILFLFPPHYFSSGIYHTGSCFVSCSYIPFNEVWFHPQTASWTISSSWMFLKIILLALLIPTVLLGFFFFPLYIVKCFSFREAHYLCTKAEYYCLGLHEETKILSQHLPLLPTFLGSSTCITECSFSSCVEFHRMLLPHLDVYSISLHL